MDLHTIQPNITEDTHITEPAFVTKKPVVNDENISGKRDEEPDFINLIKLQDFFGLWAPTFKEKELLNNIYTFFNKQNFKDLNDVYKEINKVEQKIGTPPLGLTRMGHIWNYLKVLSQISQYEDLKASFERK